LQYQRGNGHADTTISAYERDATVLNLADQFPKAPGVLRYIQHVPTWENGIEAVVRSLTARWDVQARAELRSVHGISDQRSGNGGLQGGGAGSQQLAGVAFQATLHGNRFEALAGARYDAATFAHGTIVTVDSKTHAATTVVAPSRTDAAISPRVALRYDLGQAVALRLSAGSGIREPYLNELVRGFQIGSTVFAPNVGLIPERSRSLSAGIDVAGAASHASLDFTQTVVNDAIAFLTVSPTLQQRANIDRTQTDGLTAVVERRLAGCTRVEASATTQFARVTQGPGAIVGKQLQFVPDRSISLGIDDDAGAIGLGIDASYIGQTYADDLNTEPLGAALVIGARATAPMSDGSRITLSWQNLTRQTYLTSVDRIAPPSNLILSYTLPIGGEARQPGRCRVR
ncbi:MAG: TonB-dependent receptor domain-containing protein, partial [Vulcanimicrobiaceae bacterium]